MIRPLIGNARLSRLAVIALSPLVGACISMDISDYLEDGIAAQAGVEPFGAAQRDCQRASEIAAPADATVAAQAYETCMNARGWSRP